MLARWVHFSSVFVSFGCAFFWLSPVPGSMRAADLRWSSAKTVSIVGIAAPLAFASGIAWLLATIANVTGALADVADRETLRAFFFETAFGPLEVERLILLAVLVALALAPMRARSRFAGIAATSALLLVSQAWLGHAAEDGGTLHGTVMIVCYAAHVLAGAAWIGGLPPLLLVLVELRGSGAAAAAIQPLLSRYSLLAFVAASVVVVSGIANTAFHAALAPLALIKAPYGQVLLAKVVVVALVLALAGYNRFVLMPALERGATAARTTTSLLGSIGVECALAVVVLSCAAVLGVMPPVS